MSDLDRLFYWRGIAADFYNYRGELTNVPLEHRLAILAAMGTDGTNAKAVRKQAFHLDVEPWISGLPKRLFCDQATSSIDISFHPQHIDQIHHWHIKEQNQKGTFIPADLEEVGDYIYESTRYTRRRLHLPPMALGYATFKLTNPDHTVTTELAITPQHAYNPLAEATDNTWGCIIQLYTLRNSHDWGIGDFSSLKELIRLMSEVGAGVIGLNPLHVLSPNLDTDCSPYRPIERRFINPLYIDINLLLAESPFTLSDQQLEHIQFLRKQSCVDYIGVRDLKFTLLQTLFEHGLTGSDHFFNKEQTAFFLYVAQEGQALIDYALWEAKNHQWPNRHLCQHTHTAQRIWMALCQQVPTIHIDDTNTEHIEAILFFSYLQWVADHQLAQCQALASDCGMKIGLIRDLAVGADGFGSEVQGNSDVFCPKASVGAPPDPMALKGQNWGVPPLDPANLRDTGFKHYIDLLRNNMTSCGALRIDHAMSLMRLWWCSPEAAPDHGCYVYYPFHELLSLLRLESHLHQCAIIGEDLGVVPDEFRAALYDSQIYSNKVFYFEKQGDQFTHPCDYAPQALAMINNHDVPTLASWWNETDLDIRQQLNLLEDGVEFSHIIACRRHEKMALIAMLEREDYLPDHWKNCTVESQADRALIFAILRFYSRSRSKIFVLQLEDLLLMNDPVNIPGTYLEHKNWQRKLTHDTQDIFADPHVQDLMTKITSIRNQEVE